MPAVYGYLAPTPDELDHRFRYHPPTPSKVPRFEEIRRHARDLAALVVAHTPAGREQDEAIARLEEVVFWANAAIARESDPDEITQTIG